MDRLPARHIRLRVAVLLIMLLALIPAPYAAAAEYACSEAGLDAAVAAGGIATFNCPAGGGTITTNSTKTLATDLTIDGQNHITLSGNNGRIFSIPPGYTLSLNNLTVNNTGNTGIGDGGPIQNQGTLYIANCNFTNNANGTNGGVIYNTGTLSITNTSFSNNASALNGGVIYHASGDL